jgi:hypothetical protein
MKKILIGASSLLLFACNNASTEKKPTADTIVASKQLGRPPDSAAMAAMQQAWVDFATPGDMHQ